MYKHLGENEKKSLICSLNKMLVAKKLSVNDSFRNNIQQIHDFIDLSNTVSKVILSNEDIENIKLFLTCYEDRLGLFKDYSEGFVSNLIIAYNSNLLGIDNLEKSDLSFNINEDDFYQVSTFEDYSDEDLNELLSKIGNCNTHFFSSNDAAIAQKDEDSSIEYYKQFINTEILENLYCFDDEGECIEAHSFEVVAIPLSCDIVDIGKVESIIKSLVTYAGDVYGGTYHESFNSDDYDYAVIAFNDISFIKNENFWLKFIELKPYIKTINESEGRVA